MARAILLALTMACLIAAPAWCGQNPDVKVTIHVMRHDENRTCTENLPVLAGCEDATPGGAAGYHDCDAFLVFYSLAEYNLLEYGVIQYYGGYGTMHDCSDHMLLDDSDRNHLGVTQFYNNCQPGPTAIPLWFGFWWVTAEQMCIAEHPSTGDISVGDCQDPMQIDKAPYLYCVGLGHWAYWPDPCIPSQGPVAVKASTWGEVKALFR